eukprot:TRINITY_DN1873_c0_g1_i5.p1 TRINITY_DN1873_c0_g1~~TRINITY_DN1873_c0_g1_i5.p1  ORF type:complete len:304 (-),score=38.69 TRINITY_DN1873_c0_g1_i5:253-1086(-)
MTKPAPYHMTIVMMVALCTLLTSAWKQAIESDSLTRNIAKLEPNSQLQSKCNANKCQRKINKKGLSEACQQNYCNGCAACSGGGGGGSGSSCTVQSACGGSNGCTSCQSCFQNAMGDLLNILRNIQNGQLSGASNCYDALENSIQNAYHISECFGRYPTCSAYLVCKDTAYRGLPRFQSVCPSWKQKQCNTCRDASLLQASRASGAVNSSASQAVVNANADIHSVTTARENIDASSVEASMLQQRAAAEIGQRSEHNLVRQKSLERKLDAALMNKCN